MNVFFCDLCSAPIIDGQSFILYVAGPEMLSRTLETKEDVQAYSDSIGNDQKEIYPNCKLLF